jgi:predicted nucleic acid-binding protein
MRSWIVDTGPLISYLDRRDPTHTRVTAALDQFTGELFTTSAVITEAMHFVSPNLKGPRLLLEFITTSGMTVFDFTQPDGLERAVTLMEKYSDIPMDFADATLVLLAEKLSTHEILTLDRRGFTVFRKHGDKPFNLVPSP